MEGQGDLRDAVKRGLIAEVARSFGQVRLQVTGCSMLPAVWPGDILTVRRCAGAELKPGQIVLCYRDEALVAHRLIGKSGDCYLTRGDSLYNFDRPFQEDEILGRVVTIVRDGHQIDPKSAWWHGAVRFIVRRSELSIRLLLGWKRRGWSARKASAAAIEETPLVS